VAVAVAVAVAVTVAVAVAVTVAVAVAVAVAVLSAARHAVFSTQHAHQPSLMKTVQYVLAINFQFVTNMMKTSKKM
jgi:hypothetical protein